jgi:hypothetical protein
VSGQIWAPAAFILGERHLGIVHTLSWISILFSRFVERGIAGGGGTRVTILSRTVPTVTSLKQVENGEKIYLNWKFLQQKPVMKGGRNGQE